MRTALTIFLTLTCLTIFAQTVVTGTLVDSKTLEPINYGNVFIPKTGIGCTVNTTGSFSLNVGQSTVIEVGAIGYPKHVIYNLKQDVDTISLGQIHLVYVGSSGFVTVAKKRFLSKKTRLVCVPYDNTKEINSEDFVIKCPKGGVCYKWEYDEAAFLMSLNFEMIKNYTQHQPSK
ncbi:MAG: carboxypeptidase-like regulatory domain-containing protein [Flavobacteriales bacterium]|nr:carboxypeptidase-like regulatory domain-containing protein [Flavobacteriales bacterium]